MTTTDQNQDWLDEVLLALYLGDSDMVRSQKHQVKINPILAKAKEVILAHQQAAIDKAVAEELQDLLDKTKCSKPDCNKSHKVKRENITARIAALTTPKGRKE